MHIWFSANGKENARKYTFTVFVNCSVSRKLVEPCFNFPIRVSFPWKLKSYKSTRFCGDFISHIVPYAIEQNYFEHNCREEAKFILCFSIIFPSTSPRSKHNLNEPNFAVVLLQYSPLLVEYCVRLLCWNCFFLFSFMFSSDDF